MSEPTASTQIEVLSCMVIRPSHENGSVLFLPEPRLPSSSSRQRVVWTPVESTAKISVVPRKGEGLGVAGLTEANSNRGSHSTGKKGEIPSTLSDYFPAFPWFSEGKSNSLRTCGKPQEGGTLWCNMVGVDHFYVMNVDKMKKEMVRQWSGFSLTSFKKISEDVRV